MCPLCDPRAANGATHHRQHSHPKIEYQNASVLDVDYGEGVYDVISIRGAIEHFLQDKQQLIFQKSLRALKPGGWFVGDTPANPMAEVDPSTKGLPSHEYEWRDEAHMRKELERTFSHVETSTLTSPDRVTLYWKCQKR